jgi:iron-sulfur cluster assembly protein
MSNPLPPPLTITPTAIAQIQALMDNRGKETFGVRVGIKTKGCSGMSYTLEFADAPNPFDKVVEQDGIRVLIDPKALMFVIGTQMDFEETDVKSGFTFRNPNEKGRCGCGESFHV